MGKYTHIYLYIYHIDLNPIIFRTFIVNLLYKVKIPGGVKFEFNHSVLFTLKNIIKTVIIIDIAKTRAAR